MRDFSELPPDGGIDFVMIVAVQVGPDGRVGVEIFPAMNVAEHRSVAPGNHHRLTRHPVAHLRERVPDVLPIQFDKRVHQDF